MEDDEDEFMMPCTQLPIPGADGEVFWNSNASPTTARAKVELQKKLGRPDNKAMKTVESKHQAPSPLLTIPMLHTRRKINPRAEEEEIAKEIERKKEAEESCRESLKVFAYCSRYLTKRKWVLCQEKNAVSLTNMKQVLSTEAETMGEQGQHSFTLASRFSCSHKWPGV